MKRLPIALCVSLLGIALCGGARAAVVGVSQPAQSITAERIATLPAKRRTAWLDYLKRSEAQRVADKAALAAERKPGMPVPAPPAEDARHDGMPLDRDAAWYGTPEARHVADEIVSFQTPAGGWGKNQDRSGPLRQPGQAYVPNNISHYLAPGDFDTPKEADWNYVGTLDNNATTTELHFLALVAKATPSPDGDAYRDSFVRGIRYLLEAQFPNGGWPQVWPLEGGYHDAITYNDDAVTLAAALLTDVAENEDGDYNFVSAALRAKAAAAARHALDCILATQVKVDGHLTIWAQQHDALTLKPVAARNFEPAVLSSEESADLLVYLMSLPHPSATLQTAIRAGVTFLKKAAVYGYVYTNRDAPGGRHLVVQSGAGPIWARFYDGEPSRPVFGDRDKTIHNDVNELTLERRNGYSWYNADPKKALTAYEAWSKAHPLGKAR
ncbi:MAG: pectate lyase [Alphaproteobacteria bacterium]|nr:pectate lyase [Alphaproteobacteria bacterium]MDE2163293.1 pectate lyase [Alphaproteobacteria bacterium]MDE2498945.1 pectate lyase [Alphaproteobacteria bacterium]